MRDIAGLNAKLINATTYRLSLVYPNILFLQMLAVRINQISIHIPSIDTSVTSDTDRQQNYVAEMGLLLCEEREIKLCMVCINFDAMFCKL